MLQGNNIEKKHEQTTENVKQSERESESEYQKNGLQQHNNKTANEWPIHICLDCTVFAE